MSLDMGRRESKIWLRTTGVDQEFTQMTPRRKVWRLQRDHSKIEVSGLSPGTHQLFGNTMYSHLQAYSAPSATCPLCLDNFQLSFRLSKHLKSGKGSPPMCPPQRHSLPGLLPVSPTRCMFHSSTSCVLLSTPSPTPITVPKTGAQLILFF